ncbi:hypothetical protein [Xanthobacter autotrophicus]|uniref:hypothetical protein n=1 Tax=Xanthobacter autotrophicus TaxID=280 RepID=UPI0024A741F4|nr:hypothetical protein [Xanthobacter autotrophicus]MDI4657618.1 hypothetical protein [Xanthobacter autotrophicus]
MMFGFPFHARRTPPQARDLPTAHMVARLVPAAPCGWVFFDGSETRMATEDGADLIIPGGAFFPREARRYASESDAHAEAARLNDASLCLDRPWRVKPASAFKVKRSSFADAMAQF